MKVLIVSDTHGRNSGYLDLLENSEKMDMVIHCGDVEGSEYLISESSGCKTVIVQGNNDYFSDLPRERLIKIEKIPIFMAHGHYHYVNARKDMFQSVAKQRGARIGLFGHTHVPFCEEMNGVLVANPGSLSLPRQAGFCPTYLLLWLSEDGTIQWEQCKLED